MATEAEEQEWRDPKNWRGALLTVYVAPRDPRIWVPKRRPSLGWTLNFAHRASWWWLLALLAPPLVVVALTLWTTWRSR